MKMATLAARPRPHRNPLLGTPVVAGAMAAAVWTAAGCTGRDRAGAGPVVRDSAGVQLVDNGDIDRKPAPLLSLSEPARLGPELNTAVNVRLLSDGRFAIGNRGTSQIAIVSKDGASTTWVGRKGDGPGEFQSLSGLFTCRGDSLTAYSYRARVSWFTPSGVLNRRSELRPKDGKIPWALAGVSEDCGSVLGVVVGTPPTRSNGMLQYGISLVWIDMRLEGYTPFVALPGWDMLPDESELPFGLAPVWAARGDAVYVGRNGEPELEVYAGYGKLRMIVRWRAKRESIPPEARVKHNEIRDTLIRAFGSAMMIRFKPLEEYPLPPTKPIFSRLVLDRVGRVWVQRYPNVWPAWERDFHQRFDPDAAQWWVFGADGLLVGRAATPSDFVLHDASESTVVGIARDEAGVERLVVYQLEPPRQAATTGHP